MDSSINNIEMENGEMKVTFHSSLPVNRQPLLVAITFDALRAEERKIASMSDYDAKVAIAELQKLYAGTHMTIKPAR
jgi:hypothetical protein